MQVDTLVDLVELYPAYSLLICGGLLLLNFFLLLLLFIKVSRLNKKYVKLAAAENDNQGTGVPGEDLGLGDYNRNLEFLEKGFLQRCSMLPWCVLML